MGGVAVAEFEITQRNADGETRAYESELHPRQPMKDISGRDGLEFKYYTSSKPYHNGHIQQRCLFLLEL